MVDKDIAKDWKKLVKSGQDDVVKEKFIALVPSGVPGKELYEEAAQAFNGEELAEILAEFILTVYSDCSRDDFHRWNYEHLSFLIEVSNKYDIKISENLINGLPQQLILMVKSKNLAKPDCH